MDKINNKLLIITAISLITATILACILIFKEPQYIEREIIKSDTVRIEKIDTLYKQITKTITKPKYVKEEIIRHDTLYNAPLSVKTYEDSITINNNAKVQYRATVSGYRQSLDTISFNVQYPQITNTITNTITNEKIITKYKKPKITFGLGIGAGYGLLNKKGDIYIGGQLQIPIFSK